MPQLTIVMNGYPTNRRGAWEALGTTGFDVASTQIKAYELQTGCDEAHNSKYLAALDSLAEENLAGRELLQMHIATERSLGRSTLGETSLHLD